MKMSFWSYSHNLLSSCANLLELYGCLCNHLPSPLIQHTNRLVKEPWQPVPKQKYMSLMQSHLGLIAKLPLNMSGSSCMWWGATVCTKMSPVLALNTTSWWTHKIHAVAVLLVEKYTSLSESFTRIEWICHLWALCCQQLPLVHYPWQSETGIKFPMHAFWVFPQITRFLLFGFPLFEGGGDVIFCTYVYLHHLTYIISISMCLVCSQVQ